MKILIQTIKYIKISLNVVKYFFWKFWRKAQMKKLFSLGKRSFCANFNFS